MNNVSLLLAGIGGYGATYMRALLAAADGGGFTIAGVADPYYDASPHLKDLLRLGAQPYRSIGEFYRENSAELAIVSTPIQFHGDHVGQAVGHGSHVLCEKPLGATLAEGRRILDAQSRSGRFVAIGYQWSYSQAIRALKADILAGRFGRPRRLRTLVLWPRDLSYYRRRWAGRQYVDGRAVYDSVANNAAAHYLHNMLFILGGRPDESDEPLTVTAELYRANAIENYDTAAIRITTVSGAEILFIAAHPVERVHNPVFHFAFEKGDAYCDENAGITAVFRNGERREYGNANADPDNKLWEAIAAVRSGAPLSCTARTALPHTLCIEAARLSVPEIPTFPGELIRTDEDRQLVYTRGLFDSLLTCYDNWRLPSEMGFAWARRGREVDARALL
jgi:predicted dehydrogenase